MGSRIRSGPVEQFSPMTSMGSASRMASTPLMSVPSSMRPVVSSVTWAWMGTTMPVCSQASSSPRMAAFTSRISCEVSISSRSTPPRSKALACSQKSVFNSAKLMLESSGSFIEGNFPDGPMEPATKRLCPSRLYSSARRLASRAAVRLISSTLSPRPYSFSVSRLARKVHVSITSTPTSRNERCTFSTAAGYEITR